MHVFRGPRAGPPRYKRGRYSDPGPRERDPEAELESLIMRVGEKVSKNSVCFYDISLVQSCTYTIDIHFISVGRGSV